MKRKKIAVSYYSIAGPVAVILVFIVLAGFALANEQAPVAACNAPIRLRIGAIDPRFGVSQADLRSAIQQTGDLWGSAVHRRLFEYDPNAELAVNLVYDERQETTKRYIEARQRVREIAEKATVIFNDLRSLQGLLADAERAYSSQQASFDRLREIEALAGIRSATNDRMASLQKKKLALEQLNVEINSRIEKYDSLIEASNAELKTLSDSGAVGIELIAGHYAEEDGTKRIDIFQFRDRTDLLLVLAHELGHALGLGHNHDPQSIMAPLIVTKKIVLGPKDIADVKAISDSSRCGEQEKSLTK